MCPFKGDALLRRVRIQDWEWLGKGTLVSFRVKCSIASIPRKHVAHPPKVYPMVVIVSSFARVGTRAEVPQRLTDQSHALQ